MYMSTFRIPRFVTGLFVLVATFSAHAGSPRPVGEIGSDPEIGALFHKEKARQQTQSSDMKNNGQLEECGTISINSNNQQQPNNRVGQRPGKQNVTIITGPVVNAANCR